MTFRLRRRLPESEAGKARALDLPPIEGFAEIPIRGRPPVEAEPSSGPLWGVEVENLVAAPVREVWFDSYRYEGNARLAGRFLLEPRRLASVGPATLEWEAGSLFVFGKRAAAPIRARIDCRLESYDPLQVRGPQVWDAVTARADWKGELAGIEFFDFLLEGNPRLAGGKGTVSGRLSVDRGRGELEAAISAERAEASYPRESLRGSVEGTFHLGPWRPALGVAEIAGTSLVLRDVSAASEGSRPWWGSFRVVSGRLRSVRRGLRMTSKVESRCRDARPLYTVFGVGLPRWTRGLLSLEGFSARADLDFAPSFLRVAGLDAAGGNFRVLGEVARRAEEETGAFLVEDGALKVGVEVGGGGSRLKLIGAERWFRGIVGSGQPGL